MKFEDHPAAAIFPLIPDEELDELVDSIKRNGQRRPIILFQGKILDGRNRNRACEKAGIVPKTEIYDPAKHGSSVLQFIVDENLRRRQLNASQRAVIQAQVLMALQREAEARAAKAKETPTTTPDPAPAPQVTPPATKKPTSTLADGTLVDDEEPIPSVTLTPETVTPSNVVKMPTREEAAASAGVSERTMTDAMTVAKDPEKAAEVVSGKKTVGKAAGELKDRQTEEERRKLLKRIRENCGEPFAQSFLDKELLKTLKETAAFMALDDATMKLVAPLVATGWSVSRAAAHVSRKIVGKTTVDDLMNRCIAEKGNLVFEFNGFEFAITKLQPKAPEPAKK